MSGMFGRITTIFGARMNATLDAAEDPNQTLDYSYEKLVQFQQTIQRNIADVATSKARMQQQLAQIEEQEARLDGQARQALGVNREDLARTALTRKSGLESQRRALAAQIEDLQAQQDKLLAGAERLSSKIAAFRTHKETMKAQYSAAQAQVRINEAATGLSEEMGDVQLAIQRTQDKTERMQARATALDELAGTAALPELGAGGDDIDRELAQLGVGDDVERQLAAMKGQLLSGPTAPRQLPSGAAQGADHAAHDGQTQTAEYSEQ